MLERDDTLAQACARFGLGPIIGEPVALHGGVNRVWQVRTTVGTYGVHELLGIPPEVDAIARCQRIHAIEVAAAEAGVRLPSPVPEPGTGLAAVRLGIGSGPFTAHEWVDASPVTTDSLSVEFAHSLGRSVGLLHRLALDPEPIAGDDLARRPSEDDWHAIASDAAAVGLPWSAAVDASAAALADALPQLDAWDASSGSPVVSTHRDLTPMNTLDDSGTAVLLDWESAGPVACSVELGRTALDHLLVGDEMDPVLLRSYLAGYADVQPLPPIGPDWCSLWIRGLVVFAETCARSCIAATSPASLLDFQARVVEATPAELARRFAHVDHLLAQLDRAASELG